jgi:pyruvate/2-oxoglutarate dehydrogenase complex dihydrolipoamide acyltransferase (E2) component
VIVPPQVAILGAGRIAKRVVAADGKLLAHRCFREILSLIAQLRAPLASEHDR